MVSIVSTREFLAALRTAKNISLEAYVLGVRSRITHLLEDAAQRGANVVVRLEKAPYRNATGAQDNALTARELRKSGVHVREVSGAHLKAAVLDGTAFLDDCNWRRSGDTIVRTSSKSCVQQTQDAISGTFSTSTRSFATIKDDALALEDRLLHSAQPHEDIVLESESFGRGSVYKELLRSARLGRHVRLIVSAEPFFKEHNGQELNTLRTLVQAGVAIRVSSSNQKFALAGKRAWLGSANATMEDRILDRRKAHVDAKQDWGIRTTSPTIVRNLQHVAASNWRTALPLSTFAKVLQLMRRKTANSDLQ